MLIVFPNGTLQNITFKNPNLFGLTERVQVCLFILKGLKLWPYFSVHSQRNKNALLFYCVVNKNFLLAISEIHTNMLSSVANVKNLSCKFYACAGESVFYFRHFEKANIGIKSQRRGIISTKFDCETDSQSLYIYLANSVILIDVNVLKSAQQHFRFCRISACL